VIYSSKAPEFHFRTFLKGRFRPAELRNQSFPFSFAEVQIFVFYRSLGNEFHHLHNIFLPYSVGTIGGLILNRRIPPGVKMYYHVGTVRFKPVPPAFKEMRNSFPVPWLKALTISTRSWALVEHPNKNTQHFLVKELLYNFQHACKLREQQNLWPLSKASVIISSNAVFCRFHRCNFQ